MMNKHLVICLLCLTGLAAQAQTVPHTGLELVQQLYQQYGWEASGGVVRGRRTFMEQPRQELLKWLDQNLTALLLKDRECTEKTGEICKLDFEPLWASQDPSAKNLSVAATPDPTVLKVQYIYPSNGERISLKIRIADTPVGPRVADIEYKTGSTLRTILGGKK